MLYVHGLGHFHPENVIDNAFLEALDIGTNHQWIVDRVGILERRTVLPLDYLRATKNRDLRGAQEAALYSNAETGRRAAMVALERAGLAPSQIGMVIAGGCSPDTCIPAEASRIAKALGIEVPAFDLHSACSTFGAHLHFTSAMGDALPEYVLVVTPENNTRILDYSDRASAILFGDGTSAAVVSTKHPSRVRVRHTTFGGSPAGADEVAIPRVGHFHQNGSAVQKFAIKRMTELLEGLEAQVASLAGAEASSKMVFVGHQANLTMLEAVSRRAELTSERHWHNIVHFGNQAAAGAPAVLSQRWDELQPGHFVGLVVVGSGLSWSSALFEVT